MPIGADKFPFLRDSLKWSIVPGKKNTNFFVLFYILLTRLWLWYVLCITEFLPRLEPQSWRLYPSRLRRTTTVWPLSSWSASPTETCPWRPWTYPWPDLSSSQTRMKMTTERGRSPVTVCGCLVVLTSAGVPVSLQYGQKVLLSLKILYNLTKNWNKWVVWLSMKSFYN